MMFDAVFNVSFMRLTLVPLNFFFQMSILTFQDFIDALVHTFILFLGVANLGLFLSLDEVFLVLKLLW